MLRGDECREAADLGGERQKILRPDLKQISRGVGARVERRRK